MSVPTPRSPIPLYLPMPCIFERLVCALLQPWGGVYVPGGLSGWESLPWYSRSVFAEPVSPFVEIFNSFVDRLNIRQRWDKHK